MRKTLAEALTEDSQPFTPFSSWQDVVDWGTSGRAIYYKAPLDHRPRLVKVGLVTGAPYDLRGHGDKLRVRAVGGEVDPFVADQGHADRFFRPTAK